MSNIRCICLLLFFLKPEVFAQGLRPFVPPPFIRPDSIEIVRDRWGVPHIYAPTDAEVAYGLAWAQCEDDFKTVQEMHIILCGKNGLYKGIEGAKTDYVVALLGIKEWVARNYPSLPESDKRYLEAFAAGVNRYAQLHPQEILLPKVFPVKPTDILEGFILGMAFLSSMPEALTQILNDDTAPLSDIKAMGSNAFAVHRKRTAEDETFLAINSHQPLDGPFSWYEAHLVSREGLNILGGAFPGACVIGHGVNEHIAWAHTIAYPDNYDIYKLAMHPRRRYHYRVNGKWLRLHVRRVKLSVRLTKWLRIPFWRRAYQSIYGPVLKNKSGYYAFRLPALFCVNPAGQWLRMDKARSWTEFREALSMQQLSSFNVVFASRDTIAFVHNVLIPRRHPAFQWKLTLPGDTLATLWEPPFLPLDSLPILINPKCGYLFNTNNSPFLATHPSENLDPSKYPDYAGFQKKHFNRSHRLQQLLADQNPLTWEDFKRIKYDLQYPPDTIYFVADVRKLFQLDEAKYPHLAEAIRIVKNWNRRGDTANVGASLFALGWERFLQKFGPLYFNEEPYRDVDESWFVEALEYAQNHLLRHFGTLQVPLGRLQRLRRGHRDMPLAGLPDMLVAAYSTPQPDGTLKPWAGDSYIIMVRFGPQG
ncbi:MAG: penicillin acylase family protein, partial [Flavobacteriales bacterium]|nr:penicillin acylase family protein [Flavobacteriales bacterium]